MKEESAAQLGCCHRPMALGGTGGSLSPSLDFQLFRGDQSTSHQGCRPAPPMTRNSQSSTHRTRTSWENSQKELARGPPAQPSPLITALPHHRCRTERAPAPWLSAPVPLSTPSPRSSHFSST
ncbi:zinc finger protein 683, partial [Homo sapiens]